MNNVCLVGRLVKNIELKTLNTGMKVANFDLAVKRKAKAGETPLTDFIPCVIFGKSAEFVDKYFSKGDPIGIVGKIQLRTWKDKEEKSHKVLEVIVDEASFVSSKVGNTNQMNPITKDDFYMDEEEGDLPF